jgi:hypothetical protein
VTLAIGRKDDKNARSLTATVTRRRAPNQSHGNSRGTLDNREHDICNRIAERISHILSKDYGDGAYTDLKAFKDSFDTYIVAQHLESQHGLSYLTIDRLFDSLRTLSQQSYENKALTFGCIVNPEHSGDRGNLLFPDEYFSEKKYKALSDGYRTAFEISRRGHLIAFIDLTEADLRSIKGPHYYPDWTEHIARASHQKKCGIALSRQGDILVFDSGTLRFTYRDGEWHYWNHIHLVHLLSSLARAQNVHPKIRGRVVGSMYRASLDISFRRSGGLFVLLRGKNRLREVVRRGDAIGDKRQKKPDAEFDTSIAGQKIQDISRPLTVELAGLDGAVVLANSGEFLAYGAVLRPKRQGRLRGTEGSRTKAAIGASNYGLAVKISSDGKITVYSGGIEFITV